VENYRRVIPGGDWHAAIVRLVRFYCTEPLECDGLFLLDPAEAKGARLGQGDWSRLGCDAWLGVREQEPPRALFRDLRRHTDRNEQRSAQ
jgi:type VI secretion system protein ImpH